MRESSELNAGGSSYYIIPEGRVRESGERPGPEGGCISVSNKPTPVITDTVFDMATLSFLHMNTGSGEETRSNHSAMLRSTQASLL